MPDLKAAAERLGQFCDGLMPTDEQDGYILSGRQFSDVCQVVKQFHAEHPADDDEPITRKWLLSIGGVEVESPMGPQFHDHIQFTNDRFQVWEFNGEYWLIEGYDNFELRTRRQFRQLCSALGIAIREDKE